MIELIISMSYVVNANHPDEQVFSRSFYPCWKLRSDLLSTIGMWASCRTGGRFMRWCMRGGIGDI